MLKTNTNGVKIRSYETFLMKILKTITAIFKSIAARMTEPAVGAST